MDIEESIIENEYSEYDEIFFDVIPKKLTKKSVRKKYRDKTPEANKENYWWPWANIERKKGS